MFGSCVWQTNTSQGFFSPLWDLETETPLSVLKTMFWTYCQIANTDSKDSSQASSISHLHEPRNWLLEKHKHQIFHNNFFPEAMRKLSGSGDCAWGLTLLPIFTGGTDDVSSFPTLKFPLCNDCVWSRAWNSFILNIRRSFSCILRVQRLQWEGIMLLRCLFLEGGDLCPDKASGVKNFNSKSCVIK
jgi:hypothetical protein